MQSIGLIRGLTMQCDVPRKWLGSRGGPQTFRDTLCRPARLLKTRLLQSSIAESVLVLFETKNKEFVRHHINMSKIKFYYEYYDFEFEDSKLAKHDLKPIMRNNNFSVSILAENCSQK